MPNFGVLGSKMAILGPKLWFLEFGKIFKNSDQNFGFFQKSLSSLLLEVDPQFLF